MRAITAAWLFVLLPLFSAPAFAKAVRVKWKPLEGAAKYELQVGHGSQVVAQELLSAELTLWRGRLNPGYYFYQLRAIDRFDRPGDWSSPKAIVIKPDRPQATAPPAGSTVRLVNGKSRLLLKWVAKDRGTRFLVEWQRESGTVTSVPMPLDASEYEIVEPEAGEYRWRVKSFVEAEGALPDGTPNPFGTVADSDYSGWWNFRVRAEAGYLRDHAKFRAPTLSAIPAEMSAPRFGEAPISWAPVEGAEAYEIFLEETGDRAPASAVHHAIVGNTRAQVPVTADRQYRVRVRAVASLDAKGEARILGPETAATFRTAAEASSSGGGRFTVGYGVLPYGAEFQSSAVPQVGSANVLGLAANVGAEWWLSPRWGATGDARLQAVRLDGNSLLVKSIRLGGAYRWALSSHPFGTDLVFGAGLGLQDYFGAQPGGARTDLTALGPTFGAELRHAFSRRWDGSFAARLFVPVAALRPGGTSVGSDLRFANFSLDLNGGYRFGERWSAGTTVGYERRSLGWTGSAGDTNQSRYGGFRFELQLRYEWEAER